jgi:hypothetical protein
VYPLAPELLVPLSAVVGVTVTAVALRAFVLRRLIRAVGESGIARAVAISWDGRLASLLCCVAVGNFEAGPEARGEQNQGADHDDAGTDDRLR